jgi:ABC-2 type transport system permease protein
MPRSFPGSIFAKALWERRFSIVYWVVGVVAIASLTVAVYPEIRDSDALKELLQKFPPAMMAMFGVDPTTFTTGIGYVQAQLYSFLAPMLLVAFATAAGAAVTAREEEDGTADLLLAYPVERWRVVVDGFLAIALQSALICGSLAATLFVANAAVDLRIPARGILGLNFGLWLFGLFFGGITMLVGAWLGKVRPSIGVAAGIALAAFFLQGLAPIVESLKPLQPYSPFHWLLQGDPARNGLTRGHAVLGAGVIALLAGTIVLFRFRDIRTDAPLVRKRDRRGPARFDGMLRTFFGRELWERRKTIWIWTGVVCAITGVTIAFWPTLMQTGAENLEKMLEMVPKEVFAAFGVSDPKSMLTPAGFLTARIYGSTAMIVMVVFAIAFATAKQPLELLLATPLGRERLMVSRFAAMATLLGVQALALFATVAIGNRALDLGLPIGGVAAASAGLALLALFFGAFAMCFGRGMATTAAVASFVLNALGAAVDVLAPARALSPVHWYLADSPPLLRGFAPGMFAALAGTLLLGAAAVPLFARRDIAA